MFEETTRQLISFIDRSPSCYHAVANFGSILEGAGFQSLTEGEKWTLTPGGKYYVRRNESSLIAFALPMGEPGGFQIAAAHSDSPSFKLKEDPEMDAEHKYTRLNVEKYGGMLMAPWFDRPLSIAGKAVVKDGSRIESRLVNLDRDLVLIPNLAIHMNRSVNEGYAYDPQQDLLPLFGDASAKGKLMPMIAREINCAPEDILGMDLFLYNRVPGTIWGASGEYFSCARLDDLQCAWSAVTAISRATPSKAIALCAIFDNEEVGSSTKQGADSTFLADVTERICLCLNKSREDYFTMLASSFMISADNAHAVHPNKGACADPVNRPVLNGGIVLKFNASQKYCTDAVSAALFRELCQRANVPCQSFFNRSDIAGGSTLGNLSNHHVSLITADIGLPQLAMHSPYETAGIKDTEYLLDALTVFYESALLQEAPGRYAML
ncbi:MAG: M18 family aminopeptidase [Lachnospiraceae bacterium]|nr:M18 family aminopeptidase [Lachnospiraceae bacterium]